MSENLKGFNEATQTDPDGKPSGSPWGQRALEHATNLTLASPGRGSATEAEAQAAAYARQQVEKLGIRDLRTQPFSGLRSIWVFMALVFGLALVGHAAYWLLRPVYGDLPTLVIMLIAFGLAGYILWRKYTYRTYPLRSLLPHGPSQNVVAVIPPQGQVHKRVVLVGHLDSHRAVFWWATDFLFKFFTSSSPIATWGVYAAPVLYLLTMLTGFQPFAWVGLYLAFNHFLGWFSGITADLGAYSPGANDNASAVGTVLALAERLQAEPLQNTEVTLAFTGCEETGCDGMITFIKEYREKYRDALFLDFELVGTGDQLVYLSQEGTLRKKHIPAEVESLLEEAGRGFDLKPYAKLPSGTFTETGTVWEYGLKGVTLVAKYAGKTTLPEWHRLTDVPRHLQPETLARVHQLAWQILHKTDAA